jgi:hypothetical protein
MKTYAGVDCLCFQPKCLIQLSPAIHEWPDPTNIQQLCIKSSFMNFKFDFHFVWHKSNSIVSKLFTFCVAWKGFAKSAEKLLRLQEVHGSPSLTSLFHDSSFELLTALDRCHSFTRRICSILIVPRPAGRGPRKILYVFVTLFFSPLVWKSLILPPAIKSRDISFGRSRSSPLPLLLRIKIFLK